MKQDARNIKTQIRRLGYLTDAEFCEAAEIDPNYFSAFIRSGRIYRSVTTALDKFGIRYNKPITKRKAA